MALVFDSRIEIDADAVLQKHGLGKGGAVQQQLARMAMRRMVRYLPYRSGLLIKRMQAASVPREGLIVCPGPMSRMLYHGRVMVDAETGKGPAHIPGVGYRYRRGARLRPSGRALDYDKSKNALAGPYWDRRMMAAEGSALTADLQRYVDTGVGG